MSASGDVIAANITASGILIDGPDPIDLSGDVTLGSDCTDDINILGSITASCDSLFKGQISGSQLKLTGPGSNITASNIIITGLISGSNLNITNDVTLGSACSDQINVGGDITASCNMDITGNITGSINTTASFGQLRVGAGAGAGTAFNAEQADGKDPIVHIKDNKTKGGVVLMENTFSTSDNVASIAVASFSNQDASTNDPNGTGDFDDEDLYYWSSTYFYECIADGSSLGGLTPYLNNDLNLQNNSDVNVKKDISITTYGLATETTVVNQIQI